MEQNHDHLDELEKQMIRGSLYNHTTFSTITERINTIESFLYGLIDKLFETGQINSRSLYKQVEKVKAETFAKNEHIHPGLATLREETITDTNEPVNCSERLHICKGVCCSLRFALTAEEVESGKIKWDLGKPYFIRAQENGYCCHLGAEKNCQIYADRPKVCSAYSCKGDERIWNDFDKMELNYEWIRANLPIEI